MKNFVLITIAVAVAGLIGYLLLPSDAPPLSVPDGDVVAAQDPTAGTPTTLTVPLTGEGARVEARVSLAATAPAQPSHLDEFKIAHLELTGRVVDDQGAPIADAEVGLFLRQSTESLLSGGFDFRSLRGGNFGSIRSRLQFAKTGQVVRTDIDGRFGIAAKAFPTSTLDVAVTHTAYAPAVARLEWQLKDGVLTAADIVLAPGGTITGMVVDQDERPIRGASVRYLESQGRGGRGGRGRGFTGGQSTLELLAPTAETDSDGRFELHGVPFGTLRLLGEARRHLAAESDSFELKRGEEPDQIVLKLELGARITGIVRDSHGRAVIGAEVEGTMSNTVFENMRGGNRRDGDTRGGTRDWRRIVTQMQRHRQMVETDAKGEFDLDALPHGKIKIAVTHPRYIDEERDPIDTAQTQHIEITVVRRLAVGGFVVDAATGTPLEVYGIRARKVNSNNWGQMFGRGGRESGRRGERGGRDGGRDRGYSDAERDAERMARVEEIRKTDPERADRDLARLQRDQGRRRERAQRSADREAYNKNRLGDSGEVARTVPDPTEHAGGRFLIEDLQPGEYLFDIGAPNHVKIAAGPLTLERGQKVQEVTFELQPGTTIEGVVTLAQSSEPVANADVELFLPAYDANTARSDERPSPWRRGENLGTSLSRVRTDLLGRFVLDPQLSGSYALRIQSTGNRTWVERHLALDASRRVTQLDIEIATGSVVHGKVIDLEKGKAATVVFSRKDGDRKTAKVDPGTASYEITGLAGGEYFITVELAGNRDDWRRRIGALARQEGSEPDLVLGESQEVRYDVSIVDPNLGVVTGFVYLNNKAAEGYEVRMERQSEESGDLPRGEGDRGMEMMRRLRGSTLRGSVDGDASFTVKDVPPGVYDLEIRARSRGRGRRGGSSTTLHREEVVVHIGGRIERRIDLYTGGLALTFAIANPAGEAQPPSRARASMVLSSEGQGLEPTQWRDLPSYLRLNLRSGKVESADVKIGTYLLFVDGTGFTPLQTEVTVNAGDAIPQTIELAPPPEPKAKEKTGNSGEVNKK